MAPQWSDAAAPFKLMLARESVAAYFNSAAARRCQTQVVTSISSAAEVKPCSAQVKSALRRPPPTVVAVVPSRSSQVRLTPVRVVRFRFDPGLAAATAKSRAETLPFAAALALEACVWPPVRQALVLAGLY